MYASGVYVNSSLSKFAVFVYRSMPLQLSMIDVTAKYD